MLKKVKVTEDCIAGWRENIFKADSELLSIFATGCGKTKTNQKKFKQHNETTRTNKKYM